MRWLGIDFGRHSQPLHRGQLELVCDDYDCVRYDGLYGSTHSPLRQKQTIKKEKTILAAVLAITLFIVVGAFAIGKTETKVHITDNGLDIGGMYGETIALTEIDTAYMCNLNELPKIEMRTNGYADGSVLKGYFRLTDWGKCKLFVHDAKAPVIVIHYANKHLIINLYDAEATKNLYDELQNF